MLPWPTPDRRFIDKDLELGMDLVRTFVEAAARLRHEAKLKLRWPVQKVVVQPSTLRSEKALEKLSVLFQNQLNCKELVILGPQEEFAPAVDETYYSTETETGKIAIDVRITPELKAEGIARELVRRLQTMRKEMDLEMEERVDVVIGVEAESDLTLLSPQQDYICREVRVRNLRLTTTHEILEEGYLKDWNIDGKRFRLFIKRLPR
jgi:isoleucyl-tRNA synthetase